MDDYTKRFLRDLTLSGLPFGCFWAIYASIDYGWKTGIIIGAVMGLVFGLFVAYVNAREFSKPTYPLGIQPTDTSSGMVKSEFWLQDLVSTKTFIWAGLIFALLISNLVSGTDFNSMLQTLLVIVFVILVLIWNGIKIAFTRLIIDLDGIEFVSVLYRLKITWKEVEQIERRGKNWFIVCRSCKLTTIPVLDNWLRYIDADKIISLNRFSSDFLESELSKSILHYGKQVKFASV